MICFAIVGLTMCGMAYVSSLFKLSLVGFWLLLVWWAGGCC